MLCLKGGFDRNFLYELTYIAKDPPVHGIGFAATRDLVSFLRRDSTGNPLGAAVHHAIAQGNSQSGNYLRSFVHLGFNQDERGRRVFDGMNTNIAARQLAMNIRFAAPSGAAEMYEPGSEGVLWWGDYTDEARGRAPSSLLTRCRTTDTCPKVVETFGSAEFYSLRVSPDLVGTRADRDIPLPANVRRYYIPGVRHGGGPGGFSTAADANACCMLAANPEFVSGDQSRADEGAGRVGGSRYAAATESLPEVRPRRSCPADTCRDGLSPDPRSAAARRRAGAVLRLRLRHRHFAAPRSQASSRCSRRLFARRCRRSCPEWTPTATSSPVFAPCCSRCRSVPTPVKPLAGGFFKGQIQSLGGGYIPFATTRAERLASGDSTPVARGALRHRTTPTSRASAPRPDGWWRKVSCCRTMPSG